MSVVDRRASLVSQRRSSYSTHDLSASSRSRRGDLLSSPRCEMSIGGGSSLLSNSHRRPSIDRSGRLDRNYRRSQMMLISKSQSTTHATGMDTASAKELNRSRHKRHSTSGIIGIGRRQSMVKQKSIIYGTNSVRRGLGSSDHILIDASGRSVASLDGTTHKRRKRLGVDAGAGAWLVKGSGENSFRKRSISKDDAIPQLQLPLFHDDDNTEGVQTMKKLESSSIISSSPKSKHKKKTKTVQFSTVSVRYHQIILGNNPFVTSGPPLELAWDHITSMTECTSIDEFEEEHEQYRRSEWDLALSRGERESQLLDAGFTREEIAAAIRETSRIKSHRANTVLNLKMARVEEFTEGIQSKLMQMIGFRKDPDHLYNEWKLSGVRIVQIAVQSVTKTIERLSSIGTPIPSEGNLSEHFPPIIMGPSFGITRDSLSTRFDLDGHNNNSEGGLLWPFAIVRVVSNHSPAYDAKLRKGDRILKIGCITAMNHDNLRRIPELGEVAAKKEGQVVCVVEDSNGHRRQCTIYPREWKGRGYFGFLLRKLDDGN